MNTTGPSPISVTADGCAVPGCPHPVLARGWCARHYRRWHRHGGPLIVRPRRNEAALFWAKVDTGGPIAAGAPELGPCWVWTAATHSGYGAFHTPATATRPQRRIAAHRWSYQHHHDPIPGGHQVVQLCHLADALMLGCGGGPTCGHRLCVNPAHLALAAADAPRLRGAVAQRATQLRCSRGHRFDRVDHRGQRRCSRCVRDHAAALLHALVGASSAPSGEPRRPTLARLTAGTGHTSATEPHLIAAAIPTTDEGQPA